MKTVVYLANVQHPPVQFNAARAAEDLGLVLADTAFCAGLAPFEDLETVVARWLDSGEAEVFSLHATLDEKGSVLPFGEPIRVVRHPGM